MRLLLLKQKKGRHNGLPYGVYHLSSREEALSFLYFREGTGTDTSLITS
jgi:hypothetical protein